MILQLAHHCQSFLHKFNTPNLSFFEQMVANHQKQEEILLKEKQKKLEAQVAQDKEHEQDVVINYSENLILYVFISVDQQSTRNFWRLSG